MSELISEARKDQRDTCLIDLALQGGGAHGAFTWGVLDRLLEEPWLEIDGISGTSAGAMNAAVLVSGHAEGGADCARANLEKYWRRVSQAALLSPFQRTPLDVMLGRWTLDTSPFFIAMVQCGRRRTCFWAGASSRRCRRFSSSSSSSLSSCFSA